MNHTVEIMNNGQPRRAGIVYASQERAEQWAAKLNERLGYPRSAAVLTVDGWTVRCSYEYGVSGH